MTCKTVLKTDPSMEHFEVQETHINLQDPGQRAAFLISSVEKTKAEYHGVNRTTPQSSNRQELPLQGLLSRRALFNQDK